MRVRGIGGDLDLQQLDVGSLPASPPHDPVPNRNTIPATRTPSQVWPAGARNHTKIFPTVRGLDGDGRHHALERRPDGRDQLAETETEGESLAVRESRRRVSNRNR